MSRLFAKLRRDAMQEEHTRMIATALLEANTDKPRSGAGDPQRLRGLPVVGRNVAGHIPGTRPDRIIDGRP